MEKIYDANGKEMCTIGKPGSSNRKRKRKNKKRKLIIVYGQGAKKNKWKE